MSRSRQAYRVHGLEAPPVPITTGWHPSCSCDASVVPATVLDPFGGAGTTALVVDRLGRDAISIELNPEYHAMAQARVLDEAPLLHHTPDEPDEWARMEQLGLFGGE